MSDVIIDVCKTFDPLLLVKCTAPDWTLLLLAFYWIRSQWPTGGKLKNWFSYRYISVCVCAHKRPKALTSGTYRLDFLFPITVYTPERGGMIASPLSHTPALLFSLFCLLTFSNVLAGLVYRVVNCFSESLHPTNVVIITVHRETPVCARRYKKPRLSSQSTGGIIKLTACFFFLLFHQPVVCTLSLYLRLPLRVKNNKAN